MAYDANNLNAFVPRMGAGEGGAGAGRSIALWGYRDVTAGNTLADMQAANFISDGDDQGLVVGDHILFCEDTVDSSWAQVSAIAANGNVTTIIVSNP